MKFPHYKKFKNGGFHLWYADSLSGKHELIGTFGPDGKLKNAEYAWTVRKVKPNGPDWRHLQKIGDKYFLKNK